MSCRMCENFIKKIAQAQQQGDRQAEAKQRVLYENHRKLYCVESRRERERAYEHHHR